MTRLYVPAGTTLAALGDLYERQTGRNEDFILVSQEPDSVNTIEADYERLNRRKFRKIHARLSVPQFGSTASDITPGANLLTLVDTEADICVALYSREPGSMIYTLESEGVASAQPIGNSSFAPDDFLATLEEGNQLFRESGNREGFKQWYTELVRNLVANDIHPAFSTYAHSDGAAFEIETRVDASDPEFLEWKFGIGINHDFGISANAATNLGNIFSRVFKTRLDDREWITTSFEQDAYLEDEAEEHTAAFEPPAGEPWVTDPYVWRR